MPLPDYPHRAMEECKEAGFDYASLRKENDGLKAVVTEQARVIAKLKETLEKCIFSFNNETPGGARQELTFRWAKTVLSDEFGDVKRADNQL